MTNWCRPILKNDGVVAFVNPIAVSIIQIIRRTIIFKLELLTVNIVVQIPDARAIELVVSDLKMKARTLLTTIPTLYCDAAATLSVSSSIASRFPLFSQIDASLYRERLSNLPTLSTSRKTLTLLVYLQQTITGVNFLLYSSASNEILIFSAEANLRLLSTKKHWCVDGTFRSVPHLYLQLFSAFEGDKLISLIYCLLAAKTRIIYSEVFRALKDKANELNKILSPELVTCDLGSGLIASIRLELPKACIRGCYFHFAKQFIARSKFWVILNCIRNFRRK